MNSLKHRKPLGLGDSLKKHAETNAKHPTHAQTLVLREFGTMSAAQKWATKIQAKLDGNGIINRGNESKLVTACNQVDEGCVQVELIGDLGKHLYLADLFL
jgi:hypothetical protein